jgi:hypothetical protein
MTIEQLIAYEQWRGSPSPMRDEIIKNAQTSKSQLPPVDSVMLRFPLPDPVSLAAIKREIRVKR